jgi:glycosyltransferase involved in cell wall biosynthesis
MQLPREKGHPVPAQPPRVIHVITRMILGGAQEDTLVTVEGLRNSGAYEVGIITGPETGAEGELLSEARARGIPLLIVPEMRRSVRPELDAAAYLRLRRVFRYFRPRVVHSHSSKAGVLARLAARAAGVPVVVHTIHGLAFHRYGSALANCVYVAAERVAARAADALVSCADVMTRVCLAEGIGRADQFVTTFSGMDVAAYTGADPARRARVRRELGFMENDLVIAKVARIAELKGHGMVLEAAAQVLRSVPEAKFLFVGDGDLRAEVERKARSHLPPGVVVFTGLVPPARVPELVAASDMLVHASLREGLPRVLPQALLSARPVVTFDLDGAPEVVKTGETGVLVEAGDVPGLARGIIELALDPAKRHAYGEEGRRRCIEPFSARTMVVQTDRLYRELLARKGLPAPPPLGG